MPTKRLKRVVNVLVAHTQITFIKVSQIRDTVLIANECLESRMRQEGVGIMCRLDKSGLLIVLAGHTFLVW